MDHIWNRRPRWWTATLVATACLTRPVGAAEPTPDDLSPVPSSAFAEPAVAETKIEPAAETLASEVSKPATEQPLWSLTAPRPVAPPDVRDVDWPRNAVDRFILSRLEKEGLRPSAPARPETLVRRLYFDLLGLPPTPEQVAAYVDDATPDAYERLVERLLESGHYGERWARHWLDQARFADSHGYDIDQPRPNAWRYRDWVIDAIQRDLPFDQFTVEQIAGDLLPDATVEQRTATAFHRNSLHNSEAGADPEEDRVRQTIDRANTIATVWLGLTLACAQCHDHKYDPISQREYFGFYAFLNGANDVEIVSPTLRDRLKYEIESPYFESMIDSTKDIRARYERLVAAAGQDKWESELPPLREAQWKTLEPSESSGGKGETLVPQENGSLLVEGPLSDESTYTIVAPLNVDRVTGLRLEVLPHASLPHNGPGRAPNGQFNLLSLTFRVESLDSGDDLPADPTAGPLNNIVDTSSSLDFLQHVASYSAPNSDFANCIGDRGQTGGWSVGDAVGRRHVAMLELHEPVTDARNKKIVITMRQGGPNWMQMLGCFRWSVTDSPAPFLVDDVPANAAAALATPAEQRTEEQKTTVRQYYCARDPNWSQLTNVIRKRMEFAPKHPDEVKADVIEGPTNPPKTCLFEKGDFLQLGEEVQPHTPVCLPPLTARGERPDRLDLARWIVSPNHPLTARVAVNRVWQKYFGRGLVVTDDDFGMLGAAPTHPELLDWLAQDFVDQGWSLKALHRRIVLSAAYRQSSVFREDLVDLDPDNELLARQNRVRFDAEVVRDVSLAVSGLLATQIGGKSVVQPQPFGSTDLAFNRSEKLKPDWGSGLFRRGMYVWHQRTAPHPMLNLFDAPNGNLTCTRRVRSNTPMQSLTRLNDASNYECVRTLAKQLMDEVPGAASDLASVDRRVEYLFQKCLSRGPSPEEATVFRSLYATHDEFYQTYPDLALLIVRRFVKEDEPVAMHELAAWSVLTRIVFNLEEFIVRE